MFLGTLRAVICCGEWRSRGQRIRFDRAQHSQWHTNRQRNRGRHRVRRPNITNVSGTVSLPTGAATSAKQPALGTAGSAASDVITVQGAASMTKLLVTPDSIALPAHQSTNVDQLNGTTTDTNSGTKSAGTLRVVLATDQPQLTNKLLVTPDSVALPANQSVNVSQINGVTPLMGAGNGGTGSLRVNVASDQVAIPASQSGSGRCSRATRRTRPRGSSS